MKALILAAVAALFAVPAFAQQQSCFPREAVEQSLADKYGESQRFRGLSSDGRAAEVWLNEESGTWTFTLTDPRGVTCLSADGENGTTVEPATPGEDS